MRVEEAEEAVSVLQSVAPRPAKQKQAKQAQQRQQPVERSGGGMAQCRTHTVQE
jgi:hypothetical protein